MEITGKIVYESTEGGFWGISGDDGKKYFPVNGLPGKVQSKGLRVKAKIAPSSSMSVQMWGRAIDIKSISTV